jgi:hypothetical protein
MGALQVYPVTQLIVCAGLGALLGVLVPSNLTPSRGGRAVEGAAGAAIIAFSFLLGSDRLDGESDLLPVAVGCVGAVLYLSAASEIARIWLSE